MDAGASEILQHRRGLIVWKQHRNIPLLCMQAETSDCGKDGELDCKRMAAKCRRHMRRWRG